jgi:hypothetical protein
MLGIIEWAAYQYGYEMARSAVPACALKGASEASGLKSWTKSRMTLAYPVLGREAGFSFCTKTELLMLR